MSELPDPRPFLRDSTLENVHLQQCILLPYRQSVEVISFELSAKTAALLTRHSPPTAVTPLASASAYTSSVITPAPSLNAGPLYDP